MKKTLLFLLSFLGVLALAVLLSPLLFQILPYKFERIFNRIIMIGVLVCVVAFVRIRKETFIEYGLSWKTDSLRLLLTAFLAPVIVLSLYVTLQIFMGEAALSFKDVGIGKWISRIFLAIFAGLLIGCIEEFFFRGAVFSFFNKLWAKLNHWGFFLSLVVTNVFYSILHFVHAKRPFVDSTPDFTDSLKLLIAPLMSFANFGDFWTGFVGLFIFGLMLSGLYLKTKSLYPAIGLHAGAVFFIKTDGLLVDFGSNNLLWGSGKMYDGFLSWIALGILYAVLYFTLPQADAKNPELK